MPTIPERLIALEEKQKAHEKENVTAVAALAQRIDSVEAKVDNLSPVLAGINDSMAILAADKTARDAIAGDRRSRGMDSKDWINIAIAAAVGVIALWGMLK